MPERPKRRKNNKNKKKNNRNNRSDDNKSNIEENKAIDIESCSDTTKTDVDQNTTEIVKEDSKDLLDPRENLSLEIHSEISIADKDIKNDNTKENENKESSSIDNDSVVSPTYIVETPEQAIKIKPKLNNDMKSKSCDNDDSPTIIEIIDDGNVNSDQNINIPVIDSNNVIITTEESNIKWENVNDFKLPQTELIEGILSSTTIPLNVARCEQTKTLSPEEESSLRNYLQTLNLSTNSNFNAGDIKTEIEQIINREIKYRLRRKGFVEDNIFPRAGPSRSLAVIDEEGSGDSSKTSRPQSYISDKKSDNEELEDEVFESKQTQVIRNGSSDFTNQTPSKHLIPQQCILVDAKLREPEISEARGDWTVKTVEKLTGAELVYLTSSSSSTSSIYDANDDISKGDETDASVRMITPTIEVTDTETLLSNTFLAKNNNDINKSKENIVDISAQDNIQLSNNKEDITENNAQSFSSTDTHSNGNSHEIVILSTDNIKTNLFVKDLDEKKSEILSENSDIDDKNDDKITIKTKSPQDVDEYDLEIKVLKCELNDAINNLIKEVTSDSENNNEYSKDTLRRQDSSSSVDSSQCTAKYNPTHSSLNDVSNFIHDEEVNKENTEKNSDCTHVKDVLQCISTESSSIEKNMYENAQPFTLRNICLKKISSFPYGEKILEELANVSQRLQNSVLASQSKEAIPETNLPRKENSQVPPPIQPRKSSLKKSQDDQSKPILASKPEPIYECLSPSQKMLMEKTKTVIDKDDIVQTIEAYVSKGDTKPIINQNKSTSGNSIDRAPMKSQTGSRLLALLRDTSNSPKFDSPSVCNTNLKQQPQVKDSTKSYSKRLLEEIDRTDFPVINRRFQPYLADNFKPIPPPKPSKVSSYCYESDSGIRENLFQSLSNNKKYFHYSTGNLSKEIESDISTIQNMHRYCTNLRDQKREEVSPRRPSLPKDLCDQQMEYICQKEKEVDEEIRRLEQGYNRTGNKTIYSRGPRAPMISEKESKYDQIFDSKSKSYIKNSYAPTHQGPSHPERRKISSLFSSSEEELLREKMYSEYVNQMAERERRKQHKVIKVTQIPMNNSATSKSMPTLESFNSMNNRIEQEFISKAKERWYKLGIKDPETEDEKENNVYREPRVIEHKIKVIESGEEKDVKKLPNHMQEFVRFTVNDKDDEKGSTGESDSEQASAHVVVFCAVVILVLTVGKFLLRLLRNQ